MKSSFIMFTAYKETLKSLSDEKLGRLLRFIFDYVESEEVPQIEDGETAMAFAFIKKDIDANNEKYKETCEKRKLAGQKGGLAKASKAKQKVANVANAKFAKQSVANVADNDNDNESDNDNDKDIKGKVYPTDIPKGKAKPIFYPNDETLNEKFTAYVEMRKKIRAPMTDSAIRLAIKKLDKLSGGDSEKAIAILEQSIMNSWRGLFEVKEWTKKQNDSIYDKWRNA